jgi:hypothetical protein
MSTWPERDSRVGGTRTTMVPGYQADVSLRSRMPFAIYSEQQRARGGHPPRKAGAPFVPDQPWAG